MPEKEKFEKVCPKCGSTDIRADGDFISVWDYCGSCGSKPPMGFMSFPEFPSKKIKSVQKEIRKKKGK
ncbi:MAG: hypothetical protein NT067_00090 [Candidatus Diapherotrites archaeon]|nr:hypothetical protein [Candidatus Diapherotrites archaeon]